MSCEKGYKGCEERQDEGRTNSSFHVLCNRGTKCHSCLLESTVLSRQCNMVLPSFLVVQTSCGFFDHVISLNSSLTEDHCSKHTQSK